MKQDYEMTNEDLQELIAAMRPTPAIALNCGPSQGQQASANAAWARLGAKMGFDPMTVRPNGRGDRFFSAEPSQPLKVEATKAEAIFEDKPKKPSGRRTAINLNGAEIQSNHDRQKWAEGLISQMPVGHNGRDSWLLNYGTGNEAQRMRLERGIEFNEHTNSAETVK